MQCRHFAAAVGAALLLPLTAGCGAVQTALDCGQTAVQITADVQYLRNALGNAGNSPQAAQNALDTMDKDLATLQGRTDNADVRNAAEDLDRQIVQARNALDAGDVPSAGPLVDAAGELSAVCSHS